MSENKQVSTFYSVCMVYKWSIAKYFLNSTSEHGISELFPFATYIIFIKLTRINSNMDRSAEYKSHNISIFLVVRLFR